MLKLPYQFPVLLQALVVVKDVVNPPSVALQWDLPPLLTAGGTLALTGRKHQVLLPPFLVLHHSDKDTEGREGKRGSGDCNLNTETDKYTSPSSYRKTTTG